MTEQEKRRFYESAARRFKAELKLTGARAAIHLENKNDEIFWVKVFRYICPDKKFRFIASSRSANGNVTAGCTQCLQYLDFLDDKFWIAIDSDYRYLKEEPHIRVENFVLQTYTYSFENHFCFAENLNLALQKAIAPEKPNFDFRIFLKEYSNIIYPLLVWQLYLEKIDPTIFPKNVFHRLLSLNSCPVGHLANNGAMILDILRKRAKKFISRMRKEYPEADTSWYEARCNELGVRRDNAYFYVRGHNLYDMITFISRRLVSITRSNNPEVQREHGFEYYQTSNISFGKYAEIIKLEADVRRLVCGNY